MMKESKNNTLMSANTYYSYDDKNTLAHSKTNGFN